MKNKKFKLMFYDAIACTSILYLSFLIRFDFLIPLKFESLFFKSLIWFVFIQLTVFYFAGLYARNWRYTSLFDLYAIIKAVVTSCLISVMGIFIFVESNGFSRSVYLIYFILNTIITVGIRLSVRVYYTHYHDHSFLTLLKEKKYKYYSDKWENYLNNCFFNLIALFNKIIFKVFYY